MADPTPSELQRNLEQLRNDVQAYMLREGTDRYQELERIGRRVDVLNASTISERVWNEALRRIDEQLSMQQLAAQAERADRQAAMRALEARIDEEAKERKANVRYLVGGIVSAAGAFVFDLVRAMGGGV